MDDWTQDPPGAPLEADPATDYTDGAAFDQVETLARTLCAAAGRSWDAKHCKRNHWRKRARAVLAAEQPRPMGWWARAAAWARQVLS